MRNERDIFLTNPNIGKILLIRIAEGLSTSNEVCFKKLNIYKKREDTESLIELKNTICKIFPTFICDNLKLLVAKLYLRNRTLPAIERLKIIREIHTQTIRFISYLAICCLWDLIREKKNSLDYSGEPINAIYKSYFNGLLTVSELNSNKFDNGWILLTIQRVLEENHLNLCLSEIGDFLTEFNSFETLYKANNFLTHDVPFLIENLYTKHTKEKKPLSRSQVQEIYIFAEEKLGEFLGRCGLLTQYMLLSISTIDFSFPKYSEKEYKHNYNKFKGIHMLEEESPPAIISPPMNNNSIIFSTELSSKTNEARWINLSPFIIDEKAVDLQIGLDLEFGIVPRETGRNEYTQLYYFTHRDSSGKFCYKSFREDREIKISKEYDPGRYTGFEILLDLWEEAITCICQ